MFEMLTDRVGKSLRTLSGRGRISDGDGSPLCVAGAHAGRFRDREEDASAQVPQEYHIVPAKSGEICPSHAAALSCR